ncbi:MAG TPA: hydrogenase maturation nickel metallochaperone HypA [Salinimicrobium catena]|uniref:Hydrogenase maturation factor HypA n=1 Tax=Salinimicrobium catena TaxID=390640 RepID=A0A7C2M6S0_9FLAO|nr:hydrogenase maturation nickel metallochaperone HypA [Salinimicrobium catena]
MHELPVTKSIYKIVRKHARKNRVRRVITVNLEIGILSDLEQEWIQQYFDYLSKGTFLEGTKISISRIPAIFFCNECLQKSQVESLITQDLYCIYCGSGNMSLVSGKEYTIKNMEVEE